MQAHEEFVELFKLTMHKVVEPIEAQTGKSQHILKHLKTLLGPSPPRHSPLHLDL